LTHPSPSSNDRTIRIVNLVAYCQSLQTMMRDALLQASRGNAGFSINLHEKWVIILHHQILSQMERLELSLRRRKASPARLPLPTYRAFIWLRFLSKEEHLLEHLQALHDFMQLARDIPISNRKILRFGNYRLLISLNYIPYIYRTQSHGQHLELTINECLLRAPTGMKKEVLQAALNGNRNSIKLVRKYCSSPTYQRMDQLMRGDKHSQGTSPKGSHVDLEQVFARVNRDYFHNHLEKPQLSWSQKRSRRRLGSYSAHTDTVIISRTFDEASMPNFVVDFIMYHELLHKKLGVKQANSGRHNHNKKFKDLEKQFIYFTRANEWLRQISG